ncbi:MAG TPA: translation elongation factor 4, partial [Patescibacteria group bacterium]
RNFAIIAHIDHGKSTLADRLLETTGTVDKREMKEQLLDQMELERERGITIKLQPVRMDYQVRDGQKYILNLIDTPGHVDFSYEVSRSLAAVEGALLLVDATQGVQAQTLANLYLALDQNLKIIPVVNKIDLPAANPQKVAEEISNLIDCQPEDILLVSAKTGQGVPEILEKIVELTPPPAETAHESFRGLIFDSNFDEFKGVIAYIRVVDGAVKKGDQIKFMATQAVITVLDVGYFKPHLKSAEVLKSGEIGYVVTGLKEVGQCRVGDTIAAENVKTRLPGYKEMKPMVFAGIYCKEGDDFSRLREAIEKLKLSDASLVYEPENSPALGFGYRAGFLGLLHLEIFQERLRREYDLDLIITAPSVAYKVILKNNQEIIIKSPQELPDQTQIERIDEPIMRLDVFTPKDYIGGIMTLVQEKRGVYLTTEYLDDNRAILHYEVPLAAVLVDFYDKLKSISSGYASLNYEFKEYQPAAIIKLEILVAEDKIDALSTLVYEDSAYQTGRKIVDELKNVLTRQMFEVKIQAAVGGGDKSGPGKIIAATRLPPMRKDVTAKLYGGDVTRKRKLLEKQKKGKKKMKLMGLGKVDIPPEAFIAVLKR